MTQQNIGDGNEPNPPRVSIAWAAASMLIIIGIFTLAWVGRPLVNFLVANDMLVPIVISASIICLVMLVIATSWMGEAGLIHVAMASSFFICSQIIGFAVTRTMAEAIHVVEYELLAVCIYSALRGVYSDRDLIKITILLILLIGWSDEIFQYFIPNRYFDPLDVLLNLVSGVFGVTIAIVMFDSAESHS